MQNWKEILKKRINNRLIEPEDVTFFTEVKRDLNGKWTFMGKVSWQHQELVETHEEYVCFEVFSNAANHLVPSFLEQSEALFNKMAPRLKEAIEEGHLWT